MIIRIFFIIEQVIMDWQRVMMYRESDNFIRYNE